MAKEGRPLGLVAQMLSFGASLSIMDSKGSTPLHVAAKSRNKNTMSFMKEILSLGADIDAIGNSGETPLHIAAYHDKPEVVELLLVQGANPFASDGGGNTPLHSCALGFVRRKGHWPPASFKMMLKYNAALVESLNADLMTPPQLAAFECVQDKKGHECPEEILQDSPELAILKYPLSDSTLLHRAAALDRIDAIYTLIHFSLDMEAKEPKERQRFSVLRTGRERSSLIVVLLTLIEEVLYDTSMLAAFNFPLRREARDTRAVQQIGHYL